ncbi:MAG: DUF177 domain-containing protein [Rhodoferax sp.]|uniref:YceD family protein n=1 Tax=Rhodoferax sp. TaxID=50421 RepID=UPI002727F0E3|nr:DUF177 domain-containing protein [Rhodoferax sp.]MDO8449818.1 DUF177 domain-containing protein [Rhodoferax sp.]
MKQESPPIQMDVKAFAQSAGEIAGHDSLSKYERLMQETQGLGADRLLNWSARGELRADEAGVGQVWLHLTVDVSLPLTCQRCLGPVDIAVLVNQSFRFVDSEEAAEVQDEEAEEDVLALSQDFNLANLIEDEVLMALPVVPRHEECPVDLKLAAVDPGFDAASAEKRNPFAVLAKLQGGKSS